MNEQERIIKGRRPLTLQLLVAGGLLVLCLLVSTSMGYLEVPLGAVARIIGSKVTGLAMTADPIDPLWPVVIVDVRLPRIMTAALVGGGLAVAGAVFQGILLNPLADPYTLGVSAGAAFGASLALLFNLTLVGTWSVPLLAFLGAVATLVAVIFLTAGTGRLSSNNLVLSGIIVAAILSAGISFLKYIADEQVGVIIFWLMGSFASRTWGDVALVAVVVSTAMAVIVPMSRDLNLLALGDRTARSLGVEVRRTTLVLLVAATLISAVCVSVSGIIGFVGLLVPHMMRAITGPDNRRLIPISIIAGAILLLCADTITRAVLPQEIPIGVLTALIGGPFFCYIFRKRQMGHLP
jgi:iron complex transport system permease protein